LPSGQKVALDRLETYVAYPPMQAPASYNLSQVMEEIKEQQQQMHSTNPGGVSD
jgi:arylsulfatase